MLLVLVLKCGKNFWGGSLSRDYFMCFQCGSFDGVDFLGVGRRLNIILCVFNVVPMVEFLGFWFC